MLWKIFGPNKETVAGDRNEELYNFHASQNMIRMEDNEIGEHVACMREISNAYKFFVGKPEENKLYGTLRCKCEDNIKLDLRKIG
jgi:hypothetical protein